MLPVGIESIKVAEIKVGLDRRPVKEHKVSELMESIRANGLLNPITLDQNLNLLAGLHRLTACKLLGLDQINCNIITCKDVSQARLAEIDENLIRSELEALERAELWLERDRILEQMGLRARRGDNQHTRKAGGAISARPLKTTVELAREAGYTKRTFQQGKQIARSIVPEVKNLIKGTPIAESPTKLLKLAKAGQAERERAEQAEIAARQAQAAQELNEAVQQAQVAQEARAKQRELQLAALQGLMLDRSQKLTVRGAQPKMPMAAETFSSALKIKPNDQWLLYRHLVYCGNTASTQFRNSLPSHAALAIAIAASPWQHDYLVDEARVVAALCPAGQIDQFCKSHRMPIRFELLLGGLYVAICSRQPIPAPQKLISIEDVSGVVEFLVTTYTNPGNFVLAPAMGDGEVLITCERLNRICFVGDQDPVRVSRAIARWQALTDKQPEEITY